MATDALDVRSALEAHAAECRKAMADLRPRPELPQSIRANLAGANLADADLAGAYLARADLAGANLADANLAGANLADAYLAGADLAGANLAGAYLADAYLAGADLARANLADADLAGAYLAGAKGVVDVVSVTRIGSRCATLTATKGEDGAVRLMTGCFNGTLAEFEAAVAKQHGDNEHGRAYAAAVALIRSRFGMEAPK